VTDACGSSNRSKELKSAMREWKTLDVVSSQNEVVDVGVMYKVLNSKLNTVHLQNISGGVQKC